MLIFNFGIGIDMELGSIGFEKVKKGILWPDVLNFRRNKENFVQKVPTRGRDDWIKSSLMHILLCADKVIKPLRLLSGIDEAHIVSFLRSF